MIAPRYVATRASAFRALARVNLIESLFSGTVSIERRKRVSYGRLNVSASAE
jgi:hypothetical protein